jgi:hypothetical protein
MLHPYREVPELSAGLFAICVIFIPCFSPLFPNMTMVL